MDARGRREQGAFGRSAAKALRREPHCFFWKLPAPRAYAEFQIVAERMGMLPT